METLEAGMLVTVPGEPHTSNVYVVHSVLADGNVLLSHPWAPQCFLLRNASEVNSVAPSPRTVRERCVAFALKNRASLSDNDQTELDAIAMYYVARRRFSARQLEALYSLCGKIAAIQTQHSTSLALQIVNDNKGLLDDFTEQRYQAFRNIFEGKEVCKTREHRANVFNVAGFVIAQISKTGVE